ncbi:hypothetical protein [Pseudoprimorskyibacter insulae]|uniref:hypothetical protein n=1 Tax=Pseudoprimorskyibacter insulae TaxID=1695997 RepID=UPI0011B239E4|nr:hypothetical protein [Pseudoprimorskyibacter insulae]
MSDFNTHLRPQALMSAPLQPRPQIQGVARVPPVTQTQASDLPLKRPAQELSPLVLRQQMENQTAPPSVMQLTISAFLNRPQPVSQPTTTQDLTIGVETSHDQYDLPLSEGAEEPGFQRVLHNEGLS